MEKLKFRFDVHVFNNIIDWPSGKSNPIIVDEIKQDIVSGERTVDFMIRARDRAKNRSDSHFLLFLVSLVAVLLFVVNPALILVGGFWQTYLTFCAVFNPIMCYIQFKRAVEYSGLTASYNEALSNA